MYKSNFLRTSLLAAILSGGLFLSSCQAPNDKAPNKAEIIETQSQALNDWFEARFQDELARSPMNQTYLGKMTNRDKLDDASQLAMNENAALQKAWLDEMRRDFDIDRLDAQTALSYRLYEFAAEDALATHKFGSNDYVFQHMNGPHSQLPAFMINYQSVENVEDAQNYIARLNAFKTYIGQHAERAEAQFNNGVSLPKFVYAKVAEASRNIITGTPFSEGPDSPLYADIKSKFSKLNIADDEKNALIDEAKAALLNSVQPAYLDVLNMFERHGAAASKDDGAWKLPNAEAYYASRLRHYTTTDMSADEIHEIGEPTLNSPSQIQMKGVSNISKRPPTLSMR